VFGLAYPAGAPPGKCFLRLMESATLGEVPCLVAPGRECMDSGDGVEWEGSRYGAGRAGATGSVHLRAVGRHTASIGQAQEVAEKAVSFLNIDQPYARSTALHSLTVYCPVTT